MRRPAAEKHGGRQPCGLQVDQSHRQLGPRFAFWVRMQKNLGQWAAFRQVRARKLPRWARRTAVLLAGGALLTLGIALIVLPGPAVVVIPAALGVLATEFEWAKRWRARAEAGWKRIRGPLRSTERVQEEARRLR
ncbi:MAG: PGPGW domain-containing protein [Myxococcota bacterium]|nr:PGPGW domain-containing protein [Myxococcota bacterium]